MKHRKLRNSIEAQAEGQSVASSQARQESVAVVTDSRGLPGFVDGKNNSNKYLLRFVLGRKLGWKLE